MKSLGQIILYLVPVAVILWLSGYIGERYCKNQYKSVTSLVSTYTQPAQDAKDIGRTESGKRTYQITRTELITGRWQGLKIGMALCVVYFILLFLYANKKGY